jgi:ABC-type polysaccharide transport system permease subunit
MFKLCPPALIYLVFSITQIIIDTFKGLYNTAFFKFIIMVMVTLLLNALCEEGMGIISWIIVFIPFILMSVIVTMLLYIFGLDAATGTLNTSSCSTGASSSTSVKQVTFVPTPYQNKIIVIDTNPQVSASSSTTTEPAVPTYSSSPEYESFSI